MCGRRMRVLHRTKQRKNVPPRTYGYYLCSGHQENGEGACANRRSVSAMALEAKAWRFVRGVMTEPEELLADLDRMIELKREGERGDPHQEAKVWAEELAKLERTRDGYHDQAAEGLMGLDKLREKLAVLDERRSRAERELVAHSARREELERLERDRDAVVAHYAALAPDALDSLEPEERHRFYGILGLKVHVGADGRAWAELPLRWPVSLEEDPGVYKSGVTPISVLTEGRS